MMFWRQCFSLSVVNVVITNYKNIPEDRSVWNVACCFKQPSLYLCVILFILGILICDPEAHSEPARGWWESFTSGNAHLFHWDVPRGSEMWMTVWARGIQHLGQDSLILSQKETCSSLKKKNTNKSYTHSQAAAAMLMPGPLWVCLPLIWVGSCSAHSLFTCEPIKVHRCMGMPYNVTFFPNMMEHYDQDIAASHMEVSCHKQICQTVRKTYMHWYVIWYLNVLFVVQLWFHQVIHLKVILHYICI